MDKKTLDIIKASLEEEKTKLEQDLANFSKPDSKLEDDYQSSFPDYGNDEDENANEVAEYSDRLSLEDALERQLKDVNQALANIKAGNYGICKHCGKPIEEERLKVRPTSSSCVDCKKRLTGEK